MLVGFTESTVTSTAMQRAMITFVFGAGVIACLGGTPGYDPQDPTKIVCGCHDGQSCYDAAAETDTRLGETGESAEELLYLSQCACAVRSRCLA